MRLCTCSYEENTTCRLWFIHGNRLARWLKKLQSTLLWILWSDINANHSNRNWETRSSQDFVQAGYRSVLRWSAIVLLRPRKYSIPFSKDFQDNLNWHSENIWSVHLQWPWLSASDPKGGSSMPAVAVAFRWWQGCRDPCTVRCQCTCIKGAAGFWPFRAPPALRRAY